MKKNFDEQEEESRVGGISDGDRGTSRTSNLEGCGQSMPHLN